MATRIRDVLPPPPLTFPLPPVPRIGPLLESRLHLEPAEPRDAAELPGTARVHGAVPAVGADGVQPGDARDRAEG